MGLIFEKGIKLSNKNFNAVMLRYVDEKGAIDFEDFVVCAARLRLALSTRTICFCITSRYIESQ